MPDQSRAVDTGAGVGATPDPPGTYRVDIRDLHAGDTPRLDGEDPRHTHLLANTDGALPPILVHRSTMRVIDGMHRLRAARLRGDATIRVRFYEGPDADVFLAAVRANVTHGLPLTQADRQAAASRLLTTHPHFSDRALAAITGLAARTIAQLRRLQPDHQSRTRIGLDGRAYPVDTAQARRRAVVDLIQRPHASLREVARTSGLSPTTVRDVRERLRRGDDPVPETQPRAATSRRPVPRQATVAELPSSGELLGRLSRDPSLRFTEHGRALLKTLYARCAGPPDVRLLQHHPPHCAYTLATLARVCAQQWLRFAEELQEHIENGGTGEFMGGAAS
jgi:transposase-like protein